jgi:hypothetical protein
MVTRIMELTMNYFRNLLFKQWFLFIKEIYKQYVKKKRVRTKRDYIQQASYTATFPTLSYKRHEYRNNQGCAA